MVRNKRKTAKTIAAVAISFLVLVAVCAKLCVFASKEEKVSAEIVETYKSMMKDPDSMILTSDVLYTKIESGEEVWCFKVNSKNSFGAYTGSKDVEVLGKNGNPIIFSNENDEYFIGFWEVMALSEKGTGNTFKVKRFKAKRIAKMAKCKYE